MKDLFTANTSSEGGAITIIKQRHFCATRFSIQQRILLAPVMSSSFKINNFKRKIPPPLKKKRRLQ